MRVKIFTVFHQAIDERLIYSEFTPAEVQSLFLLYAVNAAKPDKLILTLDGQARALGQVSNLIIEYRLPWHDAKLQERGFMETSCYVHLLKNGVCPSLDYVGICQYDMRWTPAAAILLRSLSLAPVTGQNAVFGLPCGPLVDAQKRMHPLTFPQNFNWGFLLQSFNRHFKTNHQPQVLIGQPLTLWQTYLMPSQVFGELAGWLEVLCGELYPWANQPPYFTHWGVMGGWTERAESLFIAIRCSEKRITLEPLPLHHDESIVKQLAITKEQYGARLA
jgi:hypothetical protein